MALVALLSVLLNVAFNYIFIAILGWGVVESIYGMLLAEALSLLAVYLFRRYNKTALKVSIIRFTANHYSWSDFLALGAPTSLSSVGLVLSVSFNLSAKLFLIVKKLAEVLILGDSNYP